MREFIRHPTDIPLRYDLADVTADQEDFLNDVSAGGLSFKSSRYITPGSHINITIPLHEPVFTAEGVVAWCREADDSFLAGVQFLGEKDEFKLRMVEQVAYIEHYKREVLESEGRSLTGTEAAKEWIAKYAGGFPGS